jgi:hypothetical protein
MKENGFSFEKEQQGGVFPTAACFRPPDTLDSRFAGSDASMDFERVVATAPVARKTWKHGRVVIVDIHRGHTLAKLVRFAIVDIERQKAGGFIQYRYSSGGAFLRG